MDLQIAANALLQGNPSQLCIDFNDDTVVNDEDVTRLANMLLMSAYCVDLDQDGYVSQSCGGPDWNGNDSNIQPGATNKCSNGIDEDCSGSDALCSTCAEGQIGARCLCGGAAYA